MRFHPRLILLASLVSTMIACQKDQALSTQDPIASDVLTKIQALGFGTKNVQKVDQGYLVEGDIVLTPELLNSTPDQKLLRIADVEQYRTTNLVKVIGSTRTITLALDSRLAAKAGYPQALQEVADRYNAENLTIKMQVVSSRANVTFSNGNGSFLASSGFPTSTGEPYNSVVVNSRSIGSGTSTTFINFCATILAHELGHCIGFRHTDYYNRAISCGGSATNEGASTVGAILIPGTPSTADPSTDNSFMLSCVSLNQNRPFTANDKTALNYLY